MPIALPKYSTPYRRISRDVRPVSQRMAEFWDKPNPMTIFCLTWTSVLAFGVMNNGAFTDFIVLLGYFYLRWAFGRSFHLPFKIPKYANIRDPRNSPPGKSGAGKAEGIMYMGNTNDKDNPDCGQEIWFTNSDIRTHILYLGTTGAGKTEGLKALVTNALAWGSGYVYVDGKADTDLWASLYAVARRFGRDDDIFALNYMTGNSDDGSTSNSMNPFATGSSSYLANMVVSFMPDAGGDNAMWKERAVALMFSLMPALTYKRDKQGLLMDVGVVRDHLDLQPIIRLSRDAALPERIIHGLQGYLNTLPGFVDAAFDDEGNEKPPSPDQPMYDLQVARQQHGYLSMQFTRSLQMLGDEYGYIFKAQLADIDMLDVVLNRRIMVTLIPALEKAGDEAANLGKIVAASLKGMMGATLGNAVEGSWETAIGSKQTRAASSFMTVFDEVGYYTAPGMAVMAAQARSLGFSLVFASQDLPSMSKRVKQEAQSIVGNCNIKLFGRLEDPTDTKDFLEKHAGQFWGYETTGFQSKHDGFFGMFMSNPLQDKMDGGSVTLRSRVAYDHVREQREGEIHMFFGDWIARGNMFFVSPEKPKALRVHRLLPVPGLNTSTTQREKVMNELISRLRDNDWTAEKAVSAVVLNPEISTMIKATALASSAIETGILAIAALSNIAAASVPATQGEAKDVKKPQSGEAIDYTYDVPVEPVAMDRDAVVMERSGTRGTAPSLYEGDQYTIDEVEKAAEYKKTASGPYVAPGNEFDVITRAGDEDDSEGAMDIKLSDDILAILQQSAQRLNEGLGGRQ